MKGGIFLSGDENQVETTEQDEDAADFFEDDRAFGFLVPVHVASKSSDYAQALPANRLQSSKFLFHKLLLDNEFKFDWFLRPCAVIVSTHITLIICSARKPFRA